MRIAVVGVGYVGLVSAACFADLGAEVYCVDVDERKINGLRKGIIPIYEPGLENLVRRGMEGDRLHFSTSIAEVMPHVEIIFIAVGTPALEDGGADLRYVFDVAREIGKHLTDYRLIVTKSTVPVGTSNKVRSIIADELAQRGIHPPYDVASNPEFLKEGAAIEDFMKPDRVVVGIDSPKAQKLMERLYKPMLLNNFRVIFMDIPSAEMTKYAANAMLATRISFMNEIANLCEELGADVGMVRLGIGSDVRIGSKFLYPGCGYGGSCFPKDVQALIHMAEEVGQQMQILQAVERVNERQKNILFEKLLARFSGDISGRKIAIWGLSFKPGTDDMREAPSLVIIHSLLSAGAKVSVYDPVAMDEAKGHLGDLVRYASDIYDSVLEADAILHVTEWKEFRMPSWEMLRRGMHTPILIDGRNVFDSSIEDYGFELINIGSKK